MTRQIHIGIDFDNTIAGYDHVFPELARDWGLVPEGYCGTKVDVREKVYDRDNGCEEWMRLQGQVYGRQMPRAVLIDGVSAFIRSCRERGIPLCIISHKTEKPHFDPEIDLRQAAMDWMADKGFFDSNGFAFSPENVHFESTRARKVGRIAEMECSHFIDDLTEVFRHPLFPRDVKGYLLSGEREQECDDTVTVCGSWQEISGAILG